MTIKSIIEQHRSDRPLLPIMPLQVPLSSDPRQLQTRISSSLSEEVWFPTISSWYFSTLHKLRLLPQRGDISCPDSQGGCAKTSWYMTHIPSCRWWAKRRQDSYNLFRLYPAWLHGLRPSQSGSLEEPPPLGVAPEGDHIDPDAGEGHRTTLCCS